MQLRPCFLVLDREHAGNISTRKLVIETAKFNVITAYSAEELLITLKAFPNVNGVVVDSMMLGTHCDEFLARLREVRADVPIVVTYDQHGNPCTTANHRLDSFDPAGLLRLLQSLEPRATAVIANHESELSD